MYKFLILITQLQEGDEFLRYAHTWEFPIALGMHALISHHYLGNSDKFSLSIGTASASAVISPARPIPTHGHSFTMTCSSPVAMESTFVWMLNVSQDVCVDCNMMMMMTPDIPCMIKDNTSAFNYDKYF